MKVPFATMFRSMQKNESVCIDSTRTTLASLRVQAYTYGKKLNTEFTVQVHPGTSFTPPEPHDIYVVTRMSRAEVQAATDDFIARSRELTNQFTASGELHMPSLVRAVRRGPKPHTTGTPDEIKKARAARIEKKFMDKNAALTIEQVFIPSLAELARLEQPAWSIGNAKLAQFARWKGCTIVEFLIYLRDRIKAETGVSMKVEQCTIRGGVPGFTFTRADGKVPVRGPKAKVIDTAEINAQVAAGKSFIEQMLAIQAADASEEPADA